MSSLVRFHCARRVGVSDSHGVGDTAGWTTYPRGHEAADDAEEGGPDREGDEEHTGHERRGPEDLEVQGRIISQAVEGKGLNKDADE